MPLLAAAVACGGAITGPAASPASTSALSGSATVFAASSLTDAFKKVADEIRRAHPATGLIFNFAGSSTLATQIANGAPADVFAAADEPSMQKLVDASLADGAPRFFARNRLQIAVAAGNPKRITSLSDLSRSDLIVVLAGPGVPAGRYALESLAKAGVSVRPASHEVDVRSVLSKVAIGEADAGIVYLTDVLSAGSRVSGVAIDEAHQVVARYPIALVKDAKNARLARAFIDFLRSEEGRRVLAGSGFSAP